MHKVTLDGEQVFLIHDFLTPAECERYIALSEDVGYADAPITTGGGPVMAKGIRNNDRVMVDDPEWARLLWERAAPLIPSPFDGYAATGLNERFRFYRYDVGQTFRRHFDGYFARDEERGRLTFMIYLNGGCAGGETVIYFRGDGETHRDSDELRVTPEAGKALVFRHELLHEGAPVIAGRKYVMRTDVMYLMRRGG